MKIWLVLIVFSLGVMPVEAGFGVSPTNIYNEYLKPGAHFEKTITLSRSDPVDDLDIIVEPSLGEIESWFKFDPGLRFVFPKGQTRKSFKVIVSVPETASYRNYEGIIRVKAMKKGEDVKGVSIVKGARLDVDLVTTELTVNEIKVKSLKMLDTKDGQPLTLAMEVENVGNIEVSPTAKIKILTLDMQELEEHTASNFGSVKPNETKTLYAKFTSSLPEGEYFVEAEVLGENIVVRKERLVLRIMGKVAQFDEGKDNSNMLTGLVNFVSDNALKIGFGLMVSAIAFLLLTRLWKSRKMQEKHSEKWALLLGESTLSRIVISIAIGVIVTLIMFFILSLIPSPKDQKDDSTSITQNQDNTVEVSNVKGAKTDSKNNISPDPLVVGVHDKDGKLMYPIYSQPFVTSNVLYYAKENEKMAVIEEKADWYRVELSNGQSGWLEKTSVKDSDTQE